MTKSFDKFKTPCFWSIFPNFGAKNFLPKNLALSHTTSYGFLAACQNSEKTNDTIPRKCPHRRMNGRMDRPHFIGPFRLPPGSKKALLNVIIMCFTKTINEDA